MRRVKLSAHMRPAADKSNFFSARREGVIASVTITLDFAAEVRRDDLLQATGSAGGVPGVNGLALGLMTGPKVTQLGLAVTGSRGCPG
jgi:hypothetical protein